MSSVITEIRSEYPGMESEHVNPKEDVWFLETVLFMFLFKKSSV